MYTHICTRSSWHFKCLPSGRSASGRCEDAFFFSSKAAGVADGVGQMEQFSEYGVDAAKWPGRWVMDLNGKP